MRADLHLHSCKSDAVVTPTQVVENAKRAGLDLMALTDHDTTDGIAEAQREAEAAGIRFIPGIELTCYHPGPPEDEIHILGYFIDPNSKALRRHCERVAEAQIRRLHAMIERLAAKGMHTTFEEVVASAPETSSLDRPHLARIMLERGWVRDFHEAFERHLGQEGDCVVIFDGPTSEETIRTIREAGGFASVAHPKYVHYPNGASSRDIASLVEMGTEGIEVYHGRHTPEEITRFGAFAKEFDLIVTGGSDCHGVPIPDGSLAIDHPALPSELAQALWETQRARLGVS